MKCINRTKPYYKKYDHKLDIVYSLMIDQNLLFPRKKPHDVKFNAFLLAEYLEKILKLKEGIDYVVRGVHVDWAYLIYIKSEEVTKDIIKLVGKKYFNSYTGPMDVISNDLLSIQFENNLWHNIYPFKVLLKFDVIQNRYPRYWNGDWKKDIVEWADDNAFGYYTIRNHTVFFTNYVDVTTFKMMHSSLVSRIENVTSDVSLRSLEKLIEVSTLALSELKEMQ